MFRTLAFRASLFCLILAPFAVTASAQIKVAVVNAQKAMADTDEIKKASAAVEAKYKNRRKNSRSFRLTSSRSKPRSTAAS